MPCTTILVGKKASYDGSTIIARNDDGGFEPKKVVVNNKTKTFKKYKSVIGHLEIELPDYQYRYTSVPNVILKSGLWPACGINEWNVAMTATETITSNPRVYAADPLVYYEKAKSKKEKDKVGGEDLVTLVLPYIKTAKEGVIRLGELLEKYGTYEANGIAFSDESEIWWLESIGGHHWIAKRVPDDKVVIMPNQFGLDEFDMEDAMTKQENNMCSSDLATFIKENHLDLSLDGKMIPRIAFGSHSDQDHLYNTPRAWYLYKNLAPKKFQESNLTPVSDDIPWSFVPDNKVTIQDVKYLLSSHYQNTPYDPYDRGNSPDKGRYRSIGVPNSDDSIILQIRGYVREEIKGIEWITLGGNNFTCSFPVYANVSKLPKYISDTSAEANTEYLYWSSRMIAALTDAHYGNNVVFTERYQNAVFNKTSEILHKYDEILTKEFKEETAEKANDEIVNLVKAETSKTLTKILDTSSNVMKTRYSRNDN